MLTSAPCSARSGHLMLNDQCEVASVTAILSGEDNNTTPSINVPRQGTVARRPGRP